MTLAAPMQHPSVAEVRAAAKKYALPVFSVVRHPIAHFASLAKVAGAATEEFFWQKARVQDFLKRVTGEGGQRLNPYHAAGLVDETFLFDAEDLQNTKAAMLPDGEVVVDTHTALDSPLPFDLPHNPPPAGAARAVLDAYAKDMGLWTLTYEKTLKEGNDEHKRERPDGLREPRPHVAAI